MNDPQDLTVSFQALFGPEAKEILRAQDDPGAFLRCYIHDLNEIKTALDHSMKFAASSLARVERGAGI